MNSEMLCKGQKPMYLVLCKHIYEKQKKSTWRIELNMENKFVASWLYLQYGKFSYYRNLLLVSDRAKYEAACVSLFAQLPGTDKTDLMTDLINAISVFR